VFVLGTLTCWQMVRIPTGNIYFMSTKLYFQERKKFTMAIIQERNGGNNLVYFIKKHLLPPYPFKMNIQVWVHLAEHDFYKRQNRKVSSFIYLSSPTEFFTGYGPWGL